MCAMMSTYMHTDKNINKELYDIETFMLIYSQKRSRVYMEIKEGRLRVTKIGTRTHIAKKDAEAWLDMVRNLSKSTVS